MPELSFMFVCKSYKHNRQARIIKNTVRPPRLTGIRGQSGILVERLSDEDFTSWWINMQSWYWSSTTNANNTSNAWNVNMNNGNVNNDNKSNNNYVWPVRLGECLSVTVYPTFFGEILRYASHDAMSKFFFLDESWVYVIMGVAKQSHFFPFKMRYINQKGILYRILFLLGKIIIVTCLVMIDRGIRLNG